MHEDLHRQQEDNIEHLRAQMNDEKEKVVTALKNQYNTMLQRMQEELDALRKRGMFCLVIIQRTLWLALRYSSLLTVPFVSGLATVTARRIAFGVHCLLSND